MLRINSSHSQSSIVDGGGPRQQVLEELSFSPAWMYMQLDMNLITPYLPITMTDPSERYQQLRPHMPEEFVLLWEMQRGDYDFNYDSSKHLVVCVSSVESRIHNNIWTVELQDDTGSNCKAWMEPKFVQEHLHKQPQEASVIRPGVVWMLSTVGMILVPPSSRSPHDDEERLERMLLITGNAIKRVWTPEQAKHHQAQADSPRQQQKFLTWMQQRKALSARNTTGINGGQNQDQGGDVTKEPAVPQPVCEKVPCSSLGHPQTQGWSHLSLVEDVPTPLATPALHHDGGRPTSQIPRAVATSSQQAISPRPESPSMPKSRADGHRCSDCTPTRGDRVTASSGAKGSPPYEKHGSHFWTNASVWNPSSFLEDSEEEHTSIQARVGSNRGVLQRLSPGKTWQQSEMDKGNPAIGSVTEGSSLFAFSSLDCVDIAAFSDGD